SGVDLYQTLREEYEVTGLDRRDFPCSPSPSVNKIDITDLEAVKELFSRLTPHFVIHAAAYTDVDGCEKDADKAYKVNALGTRNIALACQKLDIPLLYISTDFVFKGDKEIPYDEFDEPAPMNIYGKSKLAGENYIESFLSRYFIVRSSWLYGRWGKNFVATILKLARERSILEVVDDQVGSPTYTKDLSQQIKRLVATELYGTYHITNSGRCSWYEFTQEILKLAGIKGVKVTPITSEELARPAPRPKFSVLENYCLRLSLGNGMREWNEALKDFLTNDFSSQGGVSEPE
nr:dTDP-4-dehydrorhamnose reductase [Clostridia bacterium]